MEQLPAQYLLPRLLIRSSFGLPPVVNCRGTRPSQAARSRPRRAFRMTDRVVEGHAMIAPTPGISPAGGRPDLLAQRMTRVEGGIRRPSSAHCVRAASANGMIPGSSRLRLAHP